MTDLDAAGLRQEVTAVLDEYIAESEHEGEPMSFDDFVLYLQLRPKESN